MSSLPKKNNIAYYLIWAIGIITAIFSEGFFHPDEHFSTIELMHKMINPSLDTSIFGWDVNLAIRSYFQPFLYFVILAPFRFLGLSDPFMQITFLRLIHIVLFLCSLKFLLENLSLKKVDESNLFKLIGICWFIPFIMVRTSSESLSISFFLFSLAFFLKEKSTKANLALAGLFGGFSFLVRFQMGIPVFFLFAWGLLIKRKNIGSLAVYCFGIITALILLIFIDHWGYGSWPITPWNYLSENIFKSRASEFGTDPWYYYFKIALTKSVAPIGIILLIGSILFYIKNPRSALTWVSVPFILVHILIGHKEWRFLNFIYVLAPLLTYLAFESKIDFWKTKRFYKPIICFLFVINLIPLSKIMFTKAHSSIAIYKVIYRNLPENINLFTIKEDNKPDLDLMLRFYAKRPRTIPSLKLSEIQNIQGHFHLLSSTYSQSQDLKKISFCQLAYKTYPEWILNFNFFNWRERSAIWNLYSCQGPN